MHGQKCGRVTLSAVVALALTLGGCAQGGFTQAQRIGADDGTDACRRYAVALDSTGDFFAANILAGAALGGLTGAAAGAIAGGNLRGALIGGAVGVAAGAAGGYLVSLQQQQRDQAALVRQVGGDLSRENEYIDRTQLAFDELMDCRFNQARQIRADYAAGRLDRATAEAGMARVRALAQRDTALARQIDTKIRGRGEQFEVAADYVRPGTRAEMTAAPTARPASVRRAAPIRLRPDSAAPQIGQLSPRDRVTATSAGGGYTLVKTESGAEGYVASPDLQGAPPPAPRGRGLSSAALATASGGGASSPEEVRTLAGSNAARRDSFSERVAVSEHAAQSGFELAAA